MRADVVYNGSDNGFFTLYSMFKIRYETADTDGYPVLMTPTPYYLLLHWQDSGHTASTQHPPYCPGYTALGTH